MCVNCGRPYPEPTGFVATIGDDREYCSPTCYTQHMELLKDIMDLNRENFEKGGM